MKCALLCKVDATSGNLEWQRTWGTINDEHGLDTWCDASAVYTCGSFVSYPGGLLIRWDHDGNAPLDPRSFFNEVARTLRSS